MTRAPCLVLIEQSEVSRVKSILEGMPNSGIKVVAVVPESCPDAFFDTASCAVVKTRDFSYGALDKIIKPLAVANELIGVASPLGFFKEGSSSLLAADVARLAREYGCRHNNAAALYRAHNKYLMRKRLRELDIPSAKFALISSASECEQGGVEVGFPAITKPAVGAASGFVRLNKNASDLKASYRHLLDKAKESYYNINFSYSHDGQVFDNARQLLCEEYLAGTEYSVEALCLENEVVPLLIHEKLDVTHTGTCVLEPIVFTPPLSLTNEEKTRINDYVATVCAALELKNCFCHFELRMTERGPIVLEVNPRLGAARIKDNLEAFYGLSYADIFLAHTAKNHVFRPNKPRDVGANHLAMSVIYPQAKGYLKSIDGLPETLALPDILGAKCYYKCGDYLNGENEEIFLAVVGYRATGKEDILKKDALIRKTIRYEIEPV